MEMQYNNLGKSGLQVSRLSLGSWLTFGKQIADETAAELMHRPDGFFNGCLFVWAVAIIKIEVIKSKTL